jgi:type IV secretory pathway VirB4 component
MPRPSISAKRASRPSRPRADRHRRGARRAVLSVPPHRRAARRLADADHHRRGLAGARQPGGFAAQLREWLKTLRKKNASVVFATQSLADIEAVGDRAGHHRKLPDPHLPAQRARDRAADHCRSIAASASTTGRSRSSRGRRPSATITASRARGNRLFELGLGEVALAYTATSSKTDQLAIAELTEAHGRQALLAAWLRHRGLAWAADQTKE